MKLSLVLTNDWELYGEGSGDFYQIQQSRLEDLLATVESVNAPITIFAEVGQQIAHLREAPHSLSKLAIARQWEESVRQTLKRGHDVQLHWHPTWENARLENDKWNLNLKQWRMADIEPAKVVERLRDARLYLENLGRPERSSYRCVAFRAGAFCLQPIASNLPLLRQAGLLCDSSVLPGFYDYLHFDYRDVPFRSGPYWIAPDSAELSQPLENDAILELPVHTEPVIDSPLFRRFISHRMWRKLTTGAAPDENYVRWSKERDRQLLLASPEPDPLAAERAKAKAHPRWWRSYFLKRSAQMLDTDFTSPQVMVEFIGRAYDRARRRGKSELILTLIGHANNAHSFENLKRTLLALQDVYGQSLNFRTVQDVTSELYARRQRENSPSTPGVYPDPI